MADIKANMGKRSKIAAKDEGVSKDTPEVSIDEVAEQLSVSPASVKRAKAVQASGGDDLIEAVEQGNGSVLVLWYNRHSLNDNNRTGRDHKDAYQSQYRGHPAS
jgi:hypothetical protein